MTNFLFLKLLFCSKSPLGSRSSCETFQQDVRASPKILTTLEEKQKDCESQQLKRSRPKRYIQGMTGPLHL